MASTRLQRIQQLLIEEVSDIIRREVKDPRIGFVTITGADVSPDLRHARVYVSILGSQEQQADTLKGLQSAARFIRREFGTRADLRVTPEIEFRIDSGIAHGARIFDLLEQVKREDAETSVTDENEIPGVSPAAPAGPSGRTEQGTDRD
jgi:ribosome-binding factor A